MLLASAFKVQQHRHYLSLSSLAVTASKPKPYLLYPIAAAPVHTPHLLVIGSSDDSLQKLLHTLPDYTATPPGHEFGFSTLTMCKTILRNFLSRLRSQGRTQVPTNSSDEDLLHLFLRRYKPPKLFAVSAPESTC